MMSFLFAWYPRRPSFYPFYHYSWITTLWILYLCESVCEWVNQEIYVYITPTDIIKSKHLADGRRSTILSEVCDSSRLCLRFKFYECYFIMVQLINQSWSWSCHSLGQMGNKSRPVVNMMTKTLTPPLVKCFFCECVIIDTGKTDIWLLIGTYVPSLPYEGCYLRSLDRGLSSARQSWRLDALCFYYANKVDHWAGTTLTK